jgi:CBS domain-containing membrane protein
MAASAIVQAGIGVPVLRNSVLLVLAGLAYNNATGRTYPHRAPMAPHPRPVTISAQLTKTDFEAAIADYGETLAIGADDLAAYYDDPIDRAGRMSGR